MEYGRVPEFILILRAFINRQDAMTPRRNCVGVWRMSDINH